MATPLYPLPAARLVRRVAHVVPGPLWVTEWLFAVPLDYARPQTSTLQLFARSATKYETGIPSTSPHDSSQTSQRPWIVYLQGGPGFGCPEPQDTPLTRFLLNKGYQVLFLDYRGVGMSTPVTADTTPTDADTCFQYLKFFRQDNNVRDLEAVRQCLTAGIDDPDKRKWSIFGQSFGGFVALTYLSKYPEGLREVFMTGGLAPISRTPDEVYEALFKKVQQRNEAYYKKFPEDASVVRRIASYLFGHPSHAVKLPSGGRLSPKRLLTFGHMFGMHNGLDIVHSMILRMKQDLDQYGFLTRPTLDQAETFLTFDSTPIYAILHEAIYCFKDGLSSGWAAQQVGQKLVNFEWLATGYDEKYFNNIVAADEKAKPLFFTGEMIFPFMFDDYPELHRMRKVAELLAKYNHWDDLYDEDQLDNNNVPVYAATYIEDMYVEYDLAKETASKVRGIKTFETNAMYHNAIRARSEEVLQQLFKLRDDVID